MMHYPPGYKSQDHEVRRVVVTTVLAIWTAIMTISMIAILYILAGILSTLFDLAKLAN